MLYYCVFVIMGYLMGSILFAPFFGYLFKKRDIISETRDQNPGAANAFMQGGMMCGIMTLIGDIGKGFLPVFLCLNIQNTSFGIWLWNLENMR